MLSRVLSGLFSTLLVVTSLSIVAQAEEVPLTIDGVINCAHPDNAITTTCRGENPPEPMPVAPVTTEPAPAGSTITYSGDRSIDCSLPSSAGDPLCLPMTIDGKINCEHPDNAITTTCRGENPPEPTVTAPVTVDAAPAGTTITYSGDVAINCALEVNRDNNICLPMTKPDGSINCQQADNAITTTCWNRFQELSKAGADLSEEVDCSQDRFRSYPVCTGIKPQAVIDFEQSKVADSITVTTPTEPEVDNSSESTTAVVSEPTETTSQDDKETQLSERVEGQISVRNRTAKATVLNLSVSTPGAIVSVVASKKGAKAIIRELIVEDDGEFQLRLPKNLKGYTLRLLVDGEELDRVKV
ncbi:MAG: hypothetical protein ACO3YA_05070 [Candidatus Nanopelagicaceae bacterium]